jgi:hypothetical protein
MLLSACENSPNGGLYYASGCLLEVAVINQEKIAFQIISKHNGATRYVSGRARKIEEGRYDFFNSERQLQMEFKHNRVFVFETNWANQPEEERKLFEGIYTYINAPVLRKHYHEVFQVRNQ